MAQIFFPPVFQVLDANGDPYAGAKAYFYDTGTTDAITVYQDDDGATPHASPVVADSKGQFPPIYVAESVYKVVIHDADDNVIRTIDPVQVSNTSGTTPGAMGLTLLAAADVGDVWDAIGGTIPFEAYLPSDYDSSTDDATSYLETAAAASSGSGLTIVFSKTYRLQTGAEIDEDNVKFHFASPKFLIEDNANMVQVIYTNVDGRIGIMFTGDNLSITGEAYFEGLGSVGSTSLAAMVFWKCVRVKCPALMHYKNFAAGRFLLYCEHSNFGDINAVSMYGTQTLDSGTAGTAEVAAGNIFCHSGSIVAKDNYKPARYCSVIADDLGAKRSNMFCHFGDVLMKALSGSLESSGLSVRGAEYCTFGNTITEDAVFGLNIQRYDTDSGFAVNGNQFGYVVSYDNELGASSASAARVLGESSSSEVGVNYVLGVFGYDAGDYGVYAANHVHTIFGEIHMDVSDRALFLGAGETTVWYIGIRNPANEGILYDNDATGDIWAAEILTGSVNASKNCIQKLTSGTPAANTDLRFHYVRYNRNGTGNDMLYILNDGYATARQVRVYHQEGTGSGGDCRYSDSSSYKARGGRMIREIAFGAQSSISANTAGIATASFSGIETTDDIQINNKTSAVNGYVLKGACYADGTFTLESHNYTGSSGTRPARTVVVSVLFSD